MIPARFRGATEEASGNGASTGGAGSTVTVTVNRPADAIQFPPSPTALGKVTETITKSTFTETVVTRVTDNKMVYPRIIEVIFTIWPFHSFALLWDYGYFKGLLTLIVSYASLLFQYNNYYYNSYRGVPNNQSKIKKLTLKLTYASLFFQFNN